MGDEELQLCNKLAGDIKEWIWKYGYSGKKECLQQYPDSDAVDSTNLLFVLLQFLDKHDERTKQIIQNTQKELSYQKVFMHRYFSDDGLPGKEGAFILCSFWLISALAIIEDTDQALTLFERMEASMAPHGLISEEIDPITKDYLGNHPQAFSHLGYIMSAHYLHKYITRNKTKARA